MWRLWTVNLEGAGTEDSQASDFDEITLNNSSILVVIKMQQNKEKHLLEWTCNDSSCHSRNYLLRDVQISQIKQANIKTQDDGH